MDIDVSSKFPTVTNRGRQIYYWPPLPNKGQHATVYFRHDVATWKRKWADFSLYMYIPEVDPTTGKVHHEREDHCHILKRIAKHTREGAYMKLNLDAFDEAMRDPKTALTHTALVGKRKQSVTTHQCRKAVVLPCFPFP